MSETQIKLKGHARTYLGKNLLDLMKNLYHAGYGEGYNDAQDDAGFEDITGLGSNPDLIIEARETISLGEKGNNAGDSKI